MYTLKYRPLGRGYGAEGVVDIEEVSRIEFHRSGAIVHLKSGVEFAVEDQFDDIKERWNQKLKKARGPIITIPLDEGF